jgi:hypothetical protein
MSSLEVSLQRVATLAAFFIAVGALLIAARIRYWCDYGREALVITGSVLLSLGFIRLGRDEFSLYNGATSSLFSSYSLIVHGSILAVSVILHYARHCYLRNARSRERHTV